MSDELHSEPAQTLAQRLDALSRALDEAIRSSASVPVTAASAESLKQQIIALYRESDEAILAAQQAKAAAKTMAERWKQLNLAPAPTAAAAPATPLRVDYLGASTFVEKGWNLLSLGKTVESIEALRKALALAPGQGEALTLLAWALVTDGQIEAAHAPLEQARAIDPNDPLALMVWGRWLALQGHFTDADSCLERVLDAGDGRASLYAHLYRALLQRALGAYDAAALTLRQALQPGP
ncbi:MAG: tetratricopeptide repeat protein, partial [Gemmatimonadaceae bacterium]|nr:tetratricopeptide repeat protein [Gemmatimonadaceae bacterium]